MAEAGLSPRQKMITLMYLVFIAMLALQMSKEVLSAFGLMNEKFEAVNKFSEEYNGSLFTQLGDKASENAASFGVPYKKAKEVKKLSSEFYTFLGELKKKLTADYQPNEETGKLPYESMDKGDKIDEMWFSGDGYSAEGKKVIEAIENYREGLLKVFGKDVKYQFICNNIRETFDTKDIKANDGATKKYLDYHYKGFPAVASLAKLTGMQNDVKKTEQDIYNALIGNTQAQAASMKNYQAMVIMDKSAFFSGDKVTGRVVLGRYDENTVPSKVIINNNEVDIAKALEGGQVKFEFNAANVGEHDINGEFVFKEDGADVPIPIKDKYVVVPRPNSATISADKMNVLYRGVDNPLTISFAGVSDNNVNASAPGLRKDNKPGKYLINVTRFQGREVPIKVSAQIDGKTVADQKMFRVKSVPNPQGAIRGETGVIKGPKSSLEASTVSAVFDSFDFELNLRVKQFAIKIPGQPTMVVNGDKLDARAKSALNKAGRGDQITISEIKAEIIGNSDYILPKTAPVIYEISR